MKTAPFGEFERELRDLLNKHSQENESDTPDYVLARYLTDCLEVFHQAVRNREKWYGRTAVPHAESVSIGDPSKEEK